MNVCKLLVRVALSIGLLLVPNVTVGADPATAPVLYIREVKVTGDEFVVVQATKDVNLNDYWLGYNSSDTATNIVPTQQLPAQPLKAGQAVLLTSDGTTTCDAVLTAKLSFSLSDTKGTLALRQLQSSGTSSTFTTIDTVNWIKPATTAGPTTDNLDLRKETTAMTYPVWYHTPSTGSWQVGNFTACTLSFSTGGTNTVSNVTWPQNDVEPPSIIETLADDGSVAGPALPASDVGLLPPQITELLPNPSGTGNDGTDEFVELYNPNTSAFDLSGFTLQTGLTTKHSYMFPVGTTLPPQNFVAFYSVDTGLSLSNTSGGADLEDPFGAVLSQTDSYDTAKDGMSWALAKGDWYWTAKPTPGAANVINQVASTSSKKSSTARTSSKSQSAVKGASTKSSSSSASSADPAATPATPAPIHPLILAAVVVVAVGYGLYEYRHDLANRIYEFRKNRAARRIARA